MNRRQFFNEQKSTVIDCIISAVCVCVRFFFISFHFSYVLNVLTVFGSVSVNVEKKEQPFHQV